MATNPIPNHIIGGDTDTDSSPPHTTVSDVPPPSPSSPRAFASSASAARFGSSSFMSSESGHTTTNTGPVASLPTSLPASSPTTTTALDDDERHALRNEEALPVIILDAEHSSIQMTDVGITRHRRPRNNAPQDSVSISPHDPAMTIPEEASETVPASSRSIIPTTTNNDSTSSALPSPPPSPRSHRRPSEPSASCSSPSRSSASSELPRTQWPWTPPTTPPHLSFTIFLDAEQQPQPAIDDLQILAPPQLLNMEGSNSSPFQEAVEEGRADDSTPSSSRSSSGAGAREHGSLLGANNVPDHLLAVSHPDPAWGFPRAAAANSFGFIHEDEGEGDLQRQSNEGVNQLPHQTAQQQNHHQHPNNLDSSMVGCEHSSLVPPSSFEPRLSSPSPSPPSCQGEHPHSHHSLPVLQLHLLPAAHAGDSTATNAVPSDRSPGDRDDMTGVGMHPLHAQPVSVNANANANASAGGAYGGGSANADPRGGEGFGFGGLSDECECEKKPSFAPPRSCAPSTDPLLSTPIPTTTTATTDIRILSSPASGSRTPTSLNPVDPAAVNFERERFPASPASTLIGDEEDTQGMSTTTLTTTAARYSTTTATTSAADSKTKRPVWTLAMKRAESIHSPSPSPRGVKRKPSSSLSPAPVPNEAASTASSSASSPLAVLASAAAASASVSSPISGSLDRIIDTNVDADARAMSRKRRRILEPSSRASHAIASLVGVDVDAGLGAAGFDLPRVRGAGPANRRRTLRLGSGGRDDGGPSDDDDEDDDDNKGYNDHHNENADIYYPGEGGRGRVDIPDLPVPPFHPLSHSPSSQRSPLNNADGQRPPFLPPITAFNTSGFPPSSRAPQSSSSSPSTSTSPPVRGVHTAATLGPVLPSSAALTPLTYPSYASQTHAPSHGDGLGASGAGGYYSNAYYPIATGDSSYTSASSSNAASGHHHTNAYGSAGDYPASYTPTATTTTAFVTAVEDQQQQPQQDLVVPSSSGPAGSGSGSGAAPPPPYNDPHSPRTRSHSGNRGGAGANAGAGGSGPPLRSSRRRAAARSARGIGSDDPASGDEGSSDGEDGSEYDAEADDNDGTGRARASGTRRGRSTGATGASARWADGPPGRNSARRAHGDHVPSSTAAAVAAAAAANYSLHPVNSHAGLPLYSQSHSHSSSSHQHMHSSMHGGLPAAGEYFSPPPPPIHPPAYTQHPTLPSPHQLAPHHSSSSHNSLGGGGVGAGSGTKKRGNLPREVTELLKAWILGHADNPYPTDEEKKMLCLQTGLTYTQVSNWMINARRRVLPPENKHKYQRPSAAAPPRPAFGYGPGGVPFPAPPGQYGAPNAAYGGSSASNVSSNGRAGPAHLSPLSLPAPGSHDPLPQLDSTRRVGGGPASSDSPVTLPPLQWGADSARDVASVPSVPSNTRGSLVNDQSALYWTPPPTAGGDPSSYGSAPPPRSQSTRPGSSSQQHSYGSTPSPLRSRTPGPHAGSGAGAGARMGSTASPSGTMGGRAHGSTLSVDELAAYGYTREQAAYVASTSYQQPQHQQYPSQHVQAYHQYPRQQHQQQHPQSMMSAATAVMSTGAAGEYVPPRHGGYAHTSYDRVRSPGPGGGGSANGASGSRH